MEQYTNLNIVEVPLGTSFFRDRVSRFLQSNGLRMEPLDAYFAIQNEDGEILAGAGIAADVIKCVAVGEPYRSEGFLAPLVSRIVAQSAGRNLKVFTKPQYRTVFESLGFKMLAQAPEALFLENGRGLEQYCAYLRSQVVPGRCGVVVMNANPFTLGHRYLLEQAALQVDQLYVIPVKEDASDFPFAERLAMIRAGAPRGVTVLEGSDYVISAATFPTYFLKDLSTAAETQMRLDASLFAGHIAPALGNSVRFVGSEPSDPLTARYNAILQETLPAVVEIPRLHLDGAPVCASAVRQALSAGHFREASALCPDSSRPFLLAALAQRALRLELDTPLKPGLVCPGSNGAHRDMDYGIMQRGISALRPWWSRMAQATSAEELRQLGIDAEKAMLSATGGVNTHRGAIFALGLAVYSAYHAVARDVENADIQNVMQILPGKIAGEVFRIQLKDSKLHITPKPKGARRIALEGYKELFQDWLPYYSAMRQAEGDFFSCASAYNLAQEKKSPSAGASAFVLAPEKSAPEAGASALSAEQKTLLRIMSTLDDTCVVKRVGEERAKQVKEESKTTKDLKELCDRYAAEGISPGGAADMLALTIFIHSIIS